MAALPDKPLGGVIEGVVDPDGVTLFWHHPSPGVSHFGAVAFLCFWLCGWALGWATAAAQLARGAQPFLVVWLGLWTLGGVAAIWSLWVMLRPIRPESVRLEDDAFRYDPGRARHNPWQRRGWSGGFALPPRDRPTAWIERAGVAAFVLGRVGERQRLYFDHGADRIEIGAGLSEPEREWLFAVLRWWHSIPSPLSFVPTDLLGTNKGGFVSSDEPPELVVPPQLLVVGGLALALVLSCVGFCLLPRVP